MRPQHIIIEIADDLNEIEQMRVKQPFIKKHTVKALLLALLAFTAGFAFISTLDYYQTTNQRTLNMDDRAAAHAVLDVEIGASITDITIAHHKMAMKYHPDKHVGKSAEERDGAQKNFLLVQQAYELLKAAGTGYEGIKKGIFEELGPKMNSHIEEGEALIKKIKAKESMYPLTSEERNDLFKWSQWLRESPQEKYGKRWYYTVMEKGTRDKYDKIKVRIDQLRMGERESAAPLPVSVGQWSPIMMLGVVVLMWMLWKLWMFKRI